MTLPATTVTTERFPKGTSQEDINGLIELRIAAGAIRSRSERDANTQEWVIITEWNIIGGNG